MNEHPSPMDWPSPRSRIHVGVLSLLLGGAACEVVGQIGSAALDEGTSSGSAGSGATDDELGSTSSTDPQRDEVGAEAMTEGSGTDGSTSMPDVPTTTGELDDTTTSVGSDGSESSSSTGGEAGVFGPVCCLPIDEPGCPDLELEACVCQLDPYCCDTAWDQACVNAASYGACGNPCEIPPPPPGEGDCCAANDGAGCLDADVQACVCAQDPYCCMQIWDGVCAGYVEQFGCALCG